MNIKEIIELSNKLIDELCGDPNISIDFELDNNEDCRDIRINIDTKHVK